jgi:hypothetical protein
MMTSIAEALMDPQARQIARDALYRQEVIENLEYAAAYANMATEMLEMRDEAGADYFMRKFAAHAKATITYFNDLKKPAGETP